jgi:hypothetical protein
MRNNLFEPLLLPPPCGSWASIARATCANPTRGARFLFASRPGCGGVGGLHLQVMVGERLKLRWLVGDRLRL